jgi:hypothetical protein
MTVDVYTIAVALGRATPGTPQSDQWELWISDALMLISARLVGTGTGQVASLADLDPDKLDYVVREAVVAQVQRPDDATTVDVRVDDGAVAKTYRSSAGRVTIRDEWWDLLSPSESSSGAFSIRPSGCGEPHLPWCSLTLGALYCSCGTDIADHPIYELEGYL